MPRYYAYIFIVTLIIFDKYGYILSSSTNNKKENNELYLTRRRESYSFLEASLNAINTKGPTYDLILKKISTIDLPNIHKEVLKNYKFNKFKEILDIKNSALECVLDSVLRMVKALPVAIEEILEYNEFCSTLEKQFNFLSVLDKDYEEKIQECRENTSERVSNSYFSAYDGYADFIVEKYKKDPDNLFNKFNDIADCLDEFYKKITRPVYDHIKETELFTKFMKNYVKPANVHYVDYLKVFLDTFDTSLPYDSIINFFDDLYYIYSTNNTYIPCFYQL